jgi:hypothetical protein
MLLLYIYSNMAKYRIHFSEDRRRNGKPRGGGM